MKMQALHADDFVYEIRSFVNKGNIYIVGAGEFGKLIGKFLTEKGIEWKGFVDGYLKEPFETETGKMICPYSETFTEEDYFVIASKVYANSMEKQLKAVNVKDQNILLFINIQDIVWEFSDAIEDWGKYLQKVQQFHNLYKGQRCFIIGNGPSLTIEDLDKLNTENTFACNSIYAVYEKTAWRPTFYCTVDHLFVEKEYMEKNNMMYRISGCQAAFTTANGCTRLIRDDPDFRNLFYIRARWGKNKESGLPLFSDDCSSCYYAAETVTYMMIQLAVYMGFNEIYLLGVDMTYSFESHKDDIITYAKNYAKPLQNEIVRMESVYEKVNGCEFGFDAQNMLEIQRKGYLSARQYADSHGIKIYNATRGGSLDVFKRVKIDEVFRF